MRSQPVLALGLLTRNHEAFIGEALDSVLRQTLAPDLIVIVDNGSTDKTPQIVREWASGVPEIPCDLQFNTTNRNASGGLRDLIKAVRGRADYLCVLHGDDRLMANYLSHAYELVSSVDEPTVWSVGHVDLGSAPEVQPSARRRLRRLLGLRSWTGEVAVDRLLVGFGNFGAMPGAILPVEECLASGRIGDPVDTCCTEDWILWQRLLRAGVAHRATPNVVVEYRIHGGGSAADARRCEAIGLARGLAIAEATDRLSARLAAAGSSLDRVDNASSYLRGLAVAGLRDTEQMKSLQAAAAAKPSVVHLGLYWGLVLLGRPTALAIRLARAMLGPRRATWGDSRKSLG